MNKTTQTFFQRTKRPSVKITYQEDYVEIEQVEEDGSSVPAKKLILDNGEIKRISRVINKNNKI